VICNNIMFETTLCLSYMSKRDLSICTKRRLCITEMIGIAHTVQMNTINAWD
jgi:hypothetical protein